MRTPLNGSPWPCPASLLRCLTKQFFAGTRRWSERRCAAAIWYCFQASAQTARALTGFALLQGIQMSGGQVRCHLSHQLSCFADSSTSQNDNEGPCFQSRPRSLSCDVHSKAKSYVLKGAPCVGATEAAHRYCQGHFEEPGCAPARRGELLH